MSPPPSLMVTTSTVGYRASSGHCRVVQFPRLTTMGRVKNAARAAVRLPWRQNSGTPNVCRTTAVLGLNEPATRTHYQRIPSRRHMVKNFSRAGCNERFFSRLNLPPRVGGVAQASTGRRDGSTNHSEPRFPRCCTSRCLNRSNSRLHTFEKPCGQMALHKRTAQRTSNPDCTQWTDLVRRWHSTSMTAQRTTHSASSVLTDAATNKPVC